MSQESDKPLGAEKATQTDNWFRKPENGPSSTDAQTVIIVRTTLLNIIRFIIIIMSS